ncbi:DUF3499 domain-containing protein [Georgenia sp. Marseille-Q6866]
MATLTYVYADSTAVLGPLATQSEPHSYDLCEEHAHRLTAPRGWEVVRLATEFVPAPPSADDIEALADAVREASRARPGPSVPAARPGSVPRHRSPTACPSPSSDAAATCGCCPARPTDPATTLETCAPGAGRRSK